MDFTFIPETNVQSQTDLLQQLVSMLNKEKSKDLADNLQKYIQDRNNYVKTHNGKYVQIYNKGIKLLDITMLNIKDFGPDSKYEGLLMKVGNEVEG